MAYIGSKPTYMQAKDREVFTFTSPSTGTTTFTGNDDAGRRLAYNTVSGATEVFVNGVMLNSADFTATSGTSIVLATGTFADDLVTVITYNVIPQSDTVSKTAGGTFGGALVFNDTATFNETVTVNNTATFNDSAEFSSGINVTNGNVGIGTTTPGAELEVNGGSTTGTHSRIVTTGSGHNFDMVDASSTARMRNVAGRLHLTADVNNEYANSEIRMLVDNSTKMTIDASGRVTMPSQPGAAIYYNSSSHTGGSIQVINGTPTVQHNIGNYYNTSTHRFVCPVAGRYILVGSAKHQGSDFTGYFGINFYKNGNVAGANWVYNDAGGYADDSTWCQTIVNCAANDYIELRVYPQSSINVRADVAIHLLG